MTTPVIGILSYDDMKARTLAIARGRLKPAPGDPKVWVSSSEALERILSAPYKTLPTEIIRTAGDVQANGTSA